MSPTRALIPIFVVLCANCFGQIPVCVTQGGVNMPSRAEGVAELVGDFQVVCTGGTPTAFGSPIPTVDLHISLNTQVTSKLLAGTWTDALLLIDEPAQGAQRVCGTSGDTQPTPGVCTITGTGTGLGVYSGAAGRPNVFQGSQTAPNELVFTGIPFDPAGSNAVRRLRFTNLRANASGLEIAGPNQAPTSIIATIAVTPATAMPILGLTTQAVGSVQSGISTSIMGSAIFSKDVAQNAALAVNPASSGVSQFSVRFRELFPTFLKKRNIATSAFDPAALANQNDLTLGFYDAETGFYNSSFPTLSNRGNLALAGLADSGTRLMARFTQVPAGVSLFSQVSGTVTAGGPGVVRMVSADVNGAGPYSPVAGNGFGIAPLPVVNGVATAIYEVVESDQSSLATVDIPIYVAYSSNAPAVGTALVDLSYAPSSTFNGASATESVPRFAPPSSARSAFTIEQNICLTLGSSTASFEASGGPGSATVTSSCTWIPTSNVDWITFSAGSRDGSQTFAYTVAANSSSSPRSGSISFRQAGNPALQAELSVSQAANFCFWHLYPYVRDFPLAGGSGTVPIHANYPSCAWSVVSDASWITLTSPTSGIGGGTVGYQVSPNTGPYRTGTLTVSGQPENTIIFRQQGLAQSTPWPENMFPDPGPGPPGPSSYTFLFTDPEGWQDLGVLNVLINRALDGRNACYLAYDRPSNMLYLVGDNGGGLTGIALNGTGSVSNSQCTVNGASSSWGANATLFRLTLSITFNQSTFAGESIIYAAARDALQNNSGWKTVGILSVPRPAPVFPSTTSVFPGVVHGGLGATQQFVVTYRDATSSANLRSMQVLINSDLNGVSACYMGYDHVNNVLYLVKDNGGGLLLPGIVPNSGTGTVENSQCVINGSGATKTENGTDLDLLISVTFKPSFTGPKLVYTGVQTISNANSGWHALGFWKIP